MSRADPASRIFLEFFFLSIYNVFAITNIPIVHFVKSTLLRNRDHEKTRRRTPGTNCNQIA
jgi:hypothetical protein